MLAVRAFTHTAKFVTLDNTLETFTFSSTYYRYFITFGEDLASDGLPRLALDGGPDGLAPYRVIAAEAANWLKPNGWVLVEIGHDQGAAWGCGSIVEVYKGHAFVGSVGGSSGFAPEGFTVSDVTDPRRPRKVWEFKAPPGIHMHKLRVVGDHFLS